MHWAFNYIGKPWISGAQGPDSFDCWGFFRFIQAQHFDIDVPFIEIDANSYKAVATGFKSHAELQNWRHVQDAKEGDAVLCRHAKYPSHVGIWLDVDGGGVLHCVRGEGVVFSSLFALKLAGWGRLDCYRHASHT